MAIGIIGSGKVGQAIAKQLSGGGHEIIISNGHGPESLTSVVGQLGAKVKAGTILESARQNIVVLAVPWIRLEKAVSGLPNWEGRIVIDVSNQFLTGPPEFKIADLGDKTSSELVAGLLPGARVVKAFNTIPAELMGADPRQGNGHRVLFLCGDDAAAKKEFGALLEERGFALIDLGGLREGGKIQQVGGPLAGLNLLKL
jgi:8-hydroxy-5-deazaflavin:NADPH oxidoreductase